MLLRVDSDVPRWSTVCIPALEPTLAQKVRAGLVVMPANVAHGYGMRQEHFLAALARRFRPSHVAGVSLAVK